MRNYLISLFTACMICGCGEFSYKQGVGLQALDNAKRICISADKANTEKCLEADGWFIHKFDDPDASVNDEVNKTEAASIEEIKIPAASAVVDTNSPVPAKTAFTGNHSDSQKLQTANPQHIYRISSWWKMGATDKTMKMDLEQCAAGLGEENQTNIAKQLYTKALIHCMNKYGWKAFGASK